MDADDAAAPVLLEFERKANAELRGAVERLRQQLRNSRSVVHSSTQGSRELRAENGRLLARVAELEQQRDRDRVERAAAQRRFDERVAKAVAEHNRVAAAQEAEIQELRLELDVLASCGELRSRQRASPRGPSGATRNH